jgi:hypothetical protein
MHRSLIAVFLLLLPSALDAAPHCVEIPLSSIQFETPLPASFGIPWGAEQRAILRPRVILSSEGEAFVTVKESYWSVSTDKMEMLVEAEEGATLEGELLLPHPDEMKLIAHPFSFPVPKGTPGASVAFLKAKEAYYGAMVKGGIAGTAWFRHQKDTFTRELAAHGVTPQPEGAGLDLVSGELCDSMELFTGGMALSENLQLDRILQPTPGGTATIDIGTIEGLTVKEIDWEPLLTGLDPEKDTLAALVPFDQYGIFFPSFGAMTQLIEEADTFGTPILSWIKPRSESAMTKDRYQTQLALSVSRVAKLLGPSVVRSVAFTGGDQIGRAHV